MQELESESQIGNPGLDQMNSEISRVLIRPLTRDDLPEARRIFCAAFGTFLGASDPENFWADRDYVNGRFGAEHVASFAAELDGELVGSNFAIRWVASAFSGPIRCVRSGRGAVAARLWSKRLATNSRIGVSGTRGCAPFRRVRCTSRSMANSGFARGF